MGESLGLCIICKTTKEDCFDTSQGSVCRKCWTKMAFDPRQADHQKHERILIPPKPDQKVYVFVENNVLITVHGILYGFEREEDAKATLERINDPVAYPGIKIELMEALLPFQYVYRNPPLRMICIKKIENESLA